MSFSHNVCWMYYLTIYTSPPTKLSTMELIRPSLENLDWLQVFFLTLEIETAWKTTHSPNSYKCPSLCTKLIKCKFVWSSLGGAYKTSDPDYYCTRLQQCTSVCPSCALTSWHSAISYNSGYYKELRMTTVFTSSASRNCALSSGDMFFVFSKKVFK